MLETLHGQGLLDTYSSSSFRPSRTAKKEKFNVSRRIRIRKEHKTNLRLSRRRSSVLPSPLWAELNAVLKPFQLVEGYVTQEPTEVNTYIQLAREDFVNTVRARSATKTGEHRAGACESIRSEIRKSWQTHGEAGKDFPLCLRWPGEPGLRDWL